MAKSLFSDRSVPPVLASEIGTKRAKLLIAGDWIAGSRAFEVFDKFTGDLIGQGECASEEQVNDAVAAARRSFETVTLNPDERYRILLRVADLIERRRDELAQTIIAESGFPISDALNEISRTQQVFVTSAEEGKRIAGEGVPIESAPGAAHRM